MHNTVILGGMSNHCQGGLHEILWHHQNFFFDWAQLSNDLSFIAAHPSIGKDTLATDYMMLYTQRSKQHRLCLRRTTSAATLGHTMMMKYCVKVGP